MARQLTGRKQSSELQCKAEEHDCKNRRSRGDVAVCWVIYSYISVNIFLLCTTRVSCL